MQRCSSSPTTIDIDLLHIRVPPRSQPAAVGLCRHGRRRTRAALAGPAPRFRAATARLAALQHVRPGSPFGHAQTYLTTLGVRRRPPVLPRHPPDPRRSLRAHVARSRRDRSHRNCRMPRTEHRRSVGDAPPQRSPVGTVRQSRRGCGVEQGAGREPRTESRPSSANWPRRSRSRRPSAGSIAFAESATTCSGRSYLRAEAARPSGGRVFVRRRHSPSRCAWSCERRS